MTGLSIATATTRASCSSLCLASFSFFFVSLLFPFFFIFSSPPFVLTWSSLTNSTIFFLSFGPPLTLYSLPTFQFFRLHLDETIVTMPATSHVSFIKARYEFLIPPPPEKSRPTVLLLYLFHVPRLISILLDRFSFSYRKCASNGHRKLWSITFPFSIVSCASPGLTLTPINVNHSIVIRVAQKPCWSILEIKIDRKITMIYVPSSSHK